MGFLPVILMGDNSCITDDAFADVDDKLDSMAPRHQSRWGEHNIQ